MAKITLQKTGSIDNIGVKMIGYGFSGVKKTRLIQTLEAPIILNIEDKLGSISKEGIPVISGYDPKTMIDAIDFICHDSEMDQYQDIAIDSITQLAENITYEAYKRHNGDARKYVNEANMQIMTVIERLRKLNEKNIYFIAKAVELPVKARQGGPTFVPMMPGTKLQANICYLFPTVFAVQNLFDEDGNNWTNLLCQSDGEWFANDIRMVLSQDEEPNLAKLIKKLKG